MIGGRDILAMLGLDNLLPRHLGGRDDQSASGYDAIIIGAGHNGLVCASYLGKAGRNVLVIEAQITPGGAAQTGGIGDETLGPRCAHLLRNLDPGVVRDLGLQRYGLAYAAKSMPTVALDLDGNHIVLSEEIDETVQSIRAHSQNDAERYPAFIKQLMSFTALARSWNNQTPGRLRGMFERGLAEDLSADAHAIGAMGASFQKMSKPDQQQFLQLFVSSVGDFLDRSFDSDLLKGALALDGVLGQNAGAFTPGTAWSLVNQWTGFRPGKTTGTDLPLGSMGALTDALARSIAARGGEIRCGTAVRRILVEGGRAVGVELRTGERIFAPQIISATDPKTTLNDLLGPEHMETGLAGSVGAIAQKGATAKLNLVLDRMPRVIGFDYNQTPQARYLIAPSLGYIEEAFNPSKYGNNSPNPIMEITFPTLDDPNLSARNEQVMSIVVQYTPYDLSGGWDAHREDFIATCIDTIANYTSDLRPHIIAGELLAPVDLEEQFNLAGGHWHHGEPGLGRQLMMRPAPGIGQYLGPVTGLYLCSAGSHPGGGVMGLAGKNAAKRILRDNVEPLAELKSGHEVISHNAEETSAAAPEHGRSEEAAE